MPDEKTLRSSIRLKIDEILSGIEKGDLLINGDGKVTAKRVSLFDVGEVFIEKEYYHLVVDKGERVMVTIRSDGDPWAWDFVNSSTYGTIATIDEYEVHVSQIKRVGAYRFPIK